MALIIFDLDGTLVDSHKGLALAMNKVLAEYGVDVHSEEAYKTFVGNGIRKLVYRALPVDLKEQLGEAFDKMLKHYSIDYKHELEVYEGIYPLLDYLTKSHHSLALITNKYQFMAEVIMKDYFDQYPFLSIIGRVEDKPDKPDPASLITIAKQYGYSLDDTWMIGDTEVDIQTARNAKCNEVFVTWGFRSLENVMALNPETIIDKPNELLEYI